MTATSILTRENTAAARPAGTIASVHFVPTRATWPFIEHILKNTPLVRRRALTIELLQPSIQGEFALFFLEDGGRAVAIRSSEALLPKKELDAQGIVVQKISNHLFLLSDRLLPLALTEQDKKARMQPLSLPGRTVFGTITLIDGGERLHGTLQKRGDRLLISLPKANFSQLPWKEIPENTSMALAISSEMAANMGHFATMQSLLAPFQGESIHWITDILPQTNSSVYLRKEGNKQQMGIFWEQSGISAAQINDMLRTSAAFQQPKTREMQLTDGTRATEILVDPSSISVEEYTKEGKPVWRVQGADRTLLGSLQNDHASLTDSTQLMDAWLTNGEDFVPSTHRCSQAPLSGYVQMVDLLSAVEQGQIAWKEQLIRPLAESFSLAELRETPFRTQILFCE